MPRSADRQQQREAKIQAAFTKLSRKQKHTKSARILELVGLEFDLAPDTVRKIVGGHYARRRALAAERAATIVPVPT